VARLVLEQERLDGGPKLRGIVVRDHPHGSLLRPIR
jgi:hypothetical protein